MKPQIYFLVEWSVTSGNEDAFQALASKAIARVKANEPGATEYAWHFTADRRTCKIVESYLDSAAVLLHLSDVADIVNELSRIALTSRFEVFGNVSLEAQVALEGIGAVVTGKWNGL